VTIDPTHIAEPPRRTPVARRPDVLVVGGGAAGIGAAVAAARAGADTLLVERYGHLGGTLTAVTLGTIAGGYLLSGDNPVPLVGGCYAELVGRLQAVGAALPPRRWLQTATIPYDPERLKLVADELLAAAGVEVLLHGLVAGVARDDRRLGAVFVETRAGRLAIVPKVVIDCSGDGDVVFHAGAGFDVGDAGFTQFASTMFRFGNVDVARFEAVPRAERNAILERAAAEGVLLPRTSAGLQAQPGTGFVHANVTRVRQPDGRPHDYLDSWSLGEAEREGRRQAWLYESVLRERMPGFGQARIVDVGAQLGVRESRLVRGRSTLTAAHVRGCVKPPDAVALCAWALETHGADRGTRWEWLAPGDWYGIPFGCLVPRDLDNVLVAGRNLSADHEAHASTRVAAQCIALGEAAGLACAMALAAGIHPGDVDVAALRRGLCERGAILDPGVPR
jgi:hypothetical protein